MELYFAPLACSMATRIALYEAGATAVFHETDTRAKKTLDGGDFFAINPMGQVPALRTDDGELLTENQAVLQYVADQHPASGLAPAGGLDRYRLQQWLSFIATELHKNFIPLLDPAAPEGAKDYARSKLPQRLARLDQHLGDRDYLLDRFSVADGYLVTVLNWANFIRFDLTEWPAVKGFQQRVTQRPSVARALQDEMALYTAQQARRAAK